MTAKSFQRALVKKLNKVDDMSHQACGFEGPLERLDRFKFDVVEWVMEELERKTREGVAAGIKSEHSRLIAAGGPG